MSDNNYVKSGVRADGPIHFNSTMSIPNYNDTLSKSPPKFYSNLMSVPANTTLLSQMIKNKNKDVLRPLAYTFKPTALLKNILSVQAKTYRLKYGQESMLMSPSTNFGSSYSALQRA